VGDPSPSFGGIFRIVQNMGLRTWKRGKTYESNPWVGFTRTWLTCSNMSPCMQHFLHKFEKSMEQTNKQL